MEKRDFMIVRLIVTDVGQAERAADLLPEGVEPFGFSTDDFVLFGNAETREMNLIVCDTSVLPPKNEVQA